MILIRDCILAFTLGMVIATPVGWAIVSLAEWRVRRCL